MGPKSPAKSPAKFLTDQPVIAELMIKRGFTPLEPLDGSFYKKLNSIGKSKAKNIYVIKRIPSDEVYDKLKKAGDKVSKDASPGDKVSKDASPGDKVSKDASPGDKVSKDASPGDKVSKTIIYNHNKISQYITDKINLLDTLTLKYIKTTDLSPESSKPFPGYNSKEFPLPITFDLGNELEREAFEIYKELNPDIKWIFKPRNENCGRGISLGFRSGKGKALSLEIRSGERFPVSKTCSGSESRSSITSIAQEYICNPMLYRGRKTASGTSETSSLGRKFDIRVFGLVTGNPGYEKSYIYPHFIYRTSSYEFNLEDPNPFIHITNNAIQKQSPNYGKYEEANSLTDSDFDPGFDVLSEFKRIAKLVFEAMIKRARTSKSYLSEINSKGKVINFPKINSKLPPGLHLYELFGFDFMLTDDHKVKLIEVNENPGLETGNRKGDALISDMLNEVFDITFGKPERVFEKL